MGNYHARNNSSRDSLPLRKFAPKLIVDDAKNRLGIAFNCPVCKDESAHAVRLIMDRALSEKLGVAKFTITGSTWEDAHCRETFTCGGASQAGLTLTRGRVRW